MSFYSKVIADSVTEHGCRLTTLEVKYPRFIHSEIMTHRDRARNSASSRAIPWPKMMERITTEPVIPIKFGMEKSGMQIGEELPLPLIKMAEDLWLKARDHAVEAAELIHNIGNTYAATTGDHQYAGIKIHKSIPNRLTEPWMWITVVMTATSWNNLFRLRVHPDAEIHFQKIARLMQDSLEQSKPKKLLFGRWHLPYITEELDFSPGDWSYDWRKVSVARCARVSYLTQDGKRDPVKDLELFNRLCEGSGFGHWSPHEHIATPATPDVKSGPFRGWMQYRKFFLNECEKG